MTADTVVGFVITAILGAVFLWLWWSADTTARRVQDRLVVLEAALVVLKNALNLGPEPQALVDEPITEPIPVVGVDTEPMERVDVAGGLRTKPTPYRRTPKGRHAA